MQSCGRWETRWAGGLCLYVIIDGFAVDFCVDFNTCFFAAYLVFIYFINIFYFFFLFFGHTICHWMFVSLLTRMRDVFVVHLFVFCLRYYHVNCLFIYSCCSCRWFYFSQVAQLRCSHAVFVSRKKLYGVFAHRLWCVVADATKTLCHVRVGACLS